MMGYPYTIVELSSGGEPSVISMHQTLNEAVAKVRSLNGDHGPYRVRDEQTKEYVAGRPDRLG